VPDWRKSFIALATEVIEARTVLLAGLIIDATPSERL
jgi:hypothetical protein